MKKVSLFKVVLGLVAFLSVGTCVANANVDEVVFQKALNSSLETPLNVKKFDSGTIHEKTLSNGMRLVIVPNNVRPRVLVQMLYDVGSSIEEPQEKGLAHLLEHMIFKGTQSLQEGAIWKLAARYGANLNAFTSYDMTSYFFEVDSNNWKPFVSVLADCMENVLLNSEHLASEVKAVIQELRMRNDNPGAVLCEALFERCFPEDHPYFVPVIGYKKDLAALTSDRLKAFYKKYYVPERATLFVVGDVEVDDVVAQVEASFAHIPPSGKTFEPVFTKEYQKTTGFHAVLPKHWIKPNTFLTWTIPAAFDDCADVAQLTASVLGEGFQSLLYKRLVDLDQSADSLHCGVERLNNEALFLVSFQPREGKTEDCVCAINEELAKLSQNGIDEKVLARLIKSTLVKYEMAQENPTKAFLSYDVLARYVQTGLIDAAFTVGERLSHVTSQKVVEFAAQYLASNLMMRIDSIPMNDEQKEAWKLEQIKDQELEQQILAAHVRALPVPTDVELPETYAQAQSFPIPIPHATARFQLDNGLKVVIKSEANTNLCAFLFANAQIGADSVESLKLSILQQLLVEGAAGQTKDQIVDWFNDRGAQVSVGGFALCLRQDFADVFKKAFEILRNPDFLSVELSQKAEIAFQKIKNQVLQQYKAIYDSPQMLAEFEQNSRQYQGTPYGYSLEDILKALDAFEFLELRDLHKKFINPANHVLSIVGNIDPREMLVLAQDAMGGVEVFPASPSPELVTAREIESFDVPLNRDQIYLSYVRESKLPVEGISLERVAVDVLSSIFVGGGTSRLFKLREATGICYYCGGAFGGPLGTGLHRSSDMVVALVSPEKVEEACKLFESFIQDVFYSSITQQELNDARNTLRSNMADSALGVMGQVSYFFNLEMFKRDETFRQNYLDLLDSLTPQILEEVAAKYIQDGPFVRVRVGNIPQ